MSVLVIMHYDHLRHPTLCPLMTAGHINGHRTLQNPIHMYHENLDHSIF